MTVHISENDDKQCMANVIGVQRNSIPVQIINYQVHQPNSRDGHSNAGYHSHNYSSGISVLPNTSDLNFYRVPTDPQCNTSNNINSNNNNNKNNPFEDLGYDVNANFIAAEAVNYSLTFDEANYVGPIDDVEERGFLFFVFFFFVCVFFLELQIVTTKAGSDQLLVLNETVFFSCIFLVRCLE